MPLASVIIPVLPVPEDLACLERTLAALGNPPDAEILVVGAGDWRAAADALQRRMPYVRCLSAPAGRGRQMNAGAREARGRWLLFLHADTTLAPGWLEELRGLAGVPPIAGGCFRFQLDSPRRLARVLERAVAARVRWGRLPYGDQALFVRAEIFDALGGYRELPLMEDVDLVLRLRRLGRLHRSSLPATTSARRWEADGWLTRSLENVALLLLFLAGADPGRLARRYRRRAPAAAASVTSAEA